MAVLFLVKRWSYGPLQISPPVERYLTQPACRLALMQQIMETTSRTINDLEFLTLALRRSLHSFGSFLGFEPLHRFIIVHHIHRRYILLHEATVLYGVIRQRRSSEFLQVIIYSPSMNRKYL